MWGKFKLMWLVCFGVGLMGVSARTIKQKNTLPRLLIIGDYFSGYVEIGGGNKQITYDVLRVFIVNYSDDTLKFWGTNCRPTEFFSVTKNVYMHLMDECNKPNYEQMAIPPHRSLLIPLGLLVDKQPHEIVKLNVCMKFYKWHRSDRFERDKKNRLPEILTDSIVLKYNKDGNAFSSGADWEQQVQKEKLNLPTTKLYLLTADERKLYTITAEENKIRKAAEGEYDYTKENVFLIPVTVHNNSNETLKYYSMTCSWQGFYHFDSKNLSVLGSDCDKNIPTEVVVPAHSTHTDMLPFVCDKNNIRSQEYFKVGLNINKNVDTHLLNGYEEELTLYNIVWSNEVQITPK